jgi:hypothetical protein
VRHGGAELDDAEIAPDAVFVAARLVVLEDRLAVLRD